MMRKPCAPWVLENKPRNPSAMPHFRTEPVRNRTSVAESLTCMSLMLRNSSLDAHVHESCPC
jgi:hypothetical protein